MSEAALTDDEVAELDTYGPLRATDRIPIRAYQLWVREMMYGRVTPDPRGIDLMRLLAGERAEPGNNG